MEHYSRENERLKKKMRIGVELPHGAGIGRYGINLIRHLAQLDLETEYLLFPGAWRQLDLALQHEPEQTSRFWWRQVVLPRDLCRYQVSLFHGLFPSLPLLWAPTVITIYDMSPVLFPEYAERGGALLFRLLIKLFARRACRILTISEHSRRDIVNLLDVSVDKVSVALPAAEACFRPVGDANALDRTVQQYGIACPFILFVGTLEPRKNVVSLLRAYAAMRSGSRITHQLVIVGRKGWLYDEVFQTVDELCLEDDVIFTGPVPDGDLVHLYSASALFVYPSVYEGFGIPPLEAMACGTPVITSNTSSLPEVVGDAGISVDPQDVDDLASAMARVLGDPALSADMAVRGLARASKFSWARTAAQVHELYCEVLDECGR